MTRSIRAGAAMFAVFALAALPVRAQPTDPVSPPAQADPGKPGAAVKPEAATKECGKRIESLIGSVLANVDDAKPTTESQRRALDAFKSASAKALEAVRNACADEKSAAAVKELEAASEQAHSALEKLGPALENLYASLSDKQKAELKTLREQFEAMTKDWSQFALNLDRYFRSDTDPKSGQTRMCVADFCFSFGKDLNGRRDPAAPWHPPLRPGEEEI